MKSNKYFIMGLPDTGKTTYLAALWYIINNINNSELKIEKYEGDLSYLSTISNKWANFEKLLRTTESTEKLKIEILLKNKSDQKFTISFPDLSGESFQFQFINREIKNEHAELIKNCDGILFFIHPDKIREPILISDIPIHIRTDEGVASESENKTLDKKLIPTQVQLVELLQFIKYLRNDLNTHLVIVISAWDLVEKNTRPEDFIKKQTPLLWQFLISNSENICVNYYGISAQGGDLNEIDKLQEFNDNCKRVYIVDNDGNKSNDITLPFCWLLNEENEK